MPRRLMLLAALVAGCDDAGPEPNADAERTVIVSNPVAASAARAARIQASVGSGGGVAYVSLPPLAISLGVRASIVNRASVQRVVAAMQDGGFDPIAIPAADGDILDITVEQAGGSALVLSETVRAARRPVVVRTDPPPRRRDVPLNARIVIVFSEPVDSASLSDGGVRLTSNGASVPGVVAPSNSARTAYVFNYAQPLTPSTEYQLEISGQVKDGDGEYLEAAVSVVFTTGTDLTAGRIAVGTGGTVAVMNADGSGFHHVTPVMRGCCGGPTWSPDATQLAFVYNDTLYVISAEGANLRVAFGGVLNEPAWSPDGTRMAFSGSIAGTSGLFVADTNGSSVWQLTRLEDLASGDLEFPYGWDNFAAWSPDSRRIAFARYFVTTAADSLPDGLFIMNADGTGVERVRDALWGEMPAWSPDGRRIAYRDRITNCLVVLSLTSPSVKSEVACEVRDGLGSGPFDPSWSPDGNRITFAASTGIYVINADGTGRTNLGYSAMSHPAWSPR